jgi:hypothetical protein
MNIESMKFLAPVLLACVVLAGCGGGDGGGSVVAPVTTPAPAEPGIGDSVSALLAYMTGLLATTSETGEPVALGDTALAVDDTLEPAGL